MNTFTNTVLCRGGPLAFLPPRFFVGGSATNRAAAPKGVRENVRKGVHKRFRKHGKGNTEQGSFKR